MGASVGEQAPERGSHFESVVDWHYTFGVPVGTAPDANLPPDRVALRKTLMSEEWSELNEAMDACDIVEIADACADLVVTVLGTAAEYGIPFDPVWEEVQATNFAKVGSNGEVRRRHDGKIVKPPGWCPPDIVGGCNS